MIPQNWEICALCGDPLPEGEKEGPSACRECAEKVIKGLAKAKKGTNA